MTHKRLTLFAGHYGSGKTNIALNYARWLRRKGEAVTVADLDIVNPYFRTKDSEEDLKKEGIGLIVSPFANSNLDVPAMPKETYALIAERGECGVLDIGGDDRGALALGRYVPEIRAEGDYEMLFVINRARPLTRTVADTILVLREIEAACGLPFTAVVNNTNLGQATRSRSYITNYDKWRHKMAKLLFQEELCKGCGLCVNACPKGLLALSKTRLNQKGHAPVELTEPDKCVGCAFCATMCPDCVITVEK